MKNTILIFTLFLLLLLLLLLFININNNNNIYAKPINENLSQYSLNSPGNSEILSGGSMIHLSTNHIDYGERRKNSVCGYIFKINNFGSEQLLVNTINASNIDYYIDPALVFPIRIDTQETIDVRVWFRPTSFTGVISLDTIRITSNAINEPLSKISLRGVSSDPYMLLGEIYWQGRIPDNPFIDSDYFKTVSIKPINIPLPSNQYFGMVVASSNNLITCFNTSSSVTADTLWSFNTGRITGNIGSVTYEDAMQIRSDIDGDGYSEVVFGCGGDNEMVYTISGRTGKQIWAFGDSVNSGKGDINGIRADKDFNGDMVNDVICSVSGEENGSGRKSVICLNGLNGNVIFEIPQTANYLYDITNTDGGGVVSLAGSGTSNSAQFFNINGSNVYQYANPDIIWSMKDVTSITGDMIRDVVCMSGYNGRIFALNGENGNLIWERELGTGISGTIKYFPLTQIIGLNYENPFLITSGQKSIDKMNPVTGADLWSMELDSTYVLGTDIIGYTNSFVEFDIAAGTLGNNFYIISGRFHEVKFQYSFGNGDTAFACDKVSVAGERRTFTGDANEIVACSRDGRIICFTGGYYLTPNVENISSEIPDKFSLSQNYPNPFNPTTNLEFGISELGFVSLKIYNSLGLEVVTIVNETLTPGTYNYQFSTINYPLSSGVYFYRLEAGSFVETKRMVLIK